MKNFFRNLNLNTIWLSYTFLTIVSLIVLGLVINHTTKGRFFRAVFDQNDRQSANSITTESEINRTPAEPSAFNGYLFVSDTANNRLIELNNKRQITWSLDLNRLFPDNSMNDDVDSFLLTNHSHDLVIVFKQSSLVVDLNIASKKINWQYGHAHQPGNQSGFLNAPTTVINYQNNLIVADSNNCRLLVLSQQGKLLEEFGSTATCQTGQGFDVPDGLVAWNNNILVSTDGDSSLSLLNQSGQHIWKIKLPQSDDVITSVYQNQFVLVDKNDPGQIIAINENDRRLWSYPSQSNTGLLNNPSRASLISNDELLIADTGNDRVIIVNRSNMQIIWQYGVSGKAALRYGQLNSPTDVWLAG